MTETSLMTRGDWILSILVSFSIVLLVISLWFPTWIDRRRNDCNTACHPYQGKTVVVDDERRCYCLQEDGSLRPHE